MTRFRKFLFWCFAAYCAVLFAILFLRGLGGHYDFDRYPYWDRILDKINLIPFATIREQMNYITSSVYNRRVAIRNLAANLMLFVPMGFFLPMLFSKLRKFGSCIGLWLGMILAIEVIQLLTLQGSFDVDDVILNTLGFIAGYLVSLILKAFIREEN